MEKIKINQLNSLFTDRDYRLFKKKLEFLNVIDCAAYIETLQPADALKAFRMVSSDRSSEIFSYFSHDMQYSIAELISERELKNILETMYLDDAADFIKNLPHHAVSRTLKNIEPIKRNQINRYLDYDENSVGSIMTAEYIRLQRNINVKEAIETIRKTGKDKENVYTSYVTDHNHTLLGIITVKKLLFSKDDDLLDTLMDRDIITVTADQDRNIAADLIARYDLLALPVVDDEYRLIGIVSFDDAVDVMKEEASEDLQLMGAMIPSEKSYTKTGVFEMAKNRILWLLLLMFSSMITGGILGRYQHAISALPILVTFVPMLTATGGNAGSQSSTLVIRGMALSELGSGDFLKIFWKEIRVSVLVGLILSAINFVRLMIVYPGNLMLSLTVASSLLATVVIAKIIGGMLPVAAKLLKADPAIMAAPLITTIVDALSLLIYFVIAQNLLNL